MTPDEIKALIKAHVAEMSDKSCDFSHMREDEIRELIEGFGPERSFGAGKKFLLAILDNSGRNGLQSFMSRMEDIIVTKRRPINPDRDFTAEELEYYRSSPATIDRRQFIKQGATYLGVTVGTAAMVIPPTQLASEVLVDDKNSDRPMATGKIITKATLATVSMASGAVTIARSLNEMNKIRLQQVLEAISELSIGAGPNPGKPESALVALPRTMEQPKGPISRFFRRHKPESGKPTPSDSQNNRDR